MDILIICIAIIVATFFAFSNFYLRSAWLLLPVKVDKPIPQSGDEPIHFRFAMYNKVKDPTLYKPRVFLALLILYLVTLLLKLIFGGGEWDGIISFLMWATVLVFLFVGGPKSILGTFFFFFIPAGIASFFTSDGSQVIFWGVMLIGAQTGVVLLNNYFSLLYNFRLELRHRETVMGDPISKLGMLYRRIYLFFLLIVPWMVIYQVVAYMWPSLDIANFTSSFSSQTAQYSFFIIALGMALNISLFLLPMYREVLEKTTIKMAANFTTDVRSAAKKASEEDKTLREFLAEKSHDVKGYLNRKGQWRVFHRAQTAWLLGVVIGLVARILHGTIKQCTQANLISQKSELLPQEIMVGIEGLVFWSNLAFAFFALFELYEYGNPIVVKIGNILIDIHKKLPQGKDKDKDKDKDVNVNKLNVEVIWKAMRNPNVMVISEKMENLKIVGELPPELPSEQSKVED